MLMSAIAVIVAFWPPITTGGDEFGMRDVNQWVALHAGYQKFIAIATV